MMHLNPDQKRRGNLRWLGLPLSTLLGLLVCSGLLFMVDRAASPIARAEPLPGGAPKLILSIKTVTPTLTTPGSVPLTYTMRLVNTGAWTATAASLRDTLPAALNYVSGSLQSSGGSAGVANDVLTWTGNINFDSAVEITFSASLSPTFTSTLVTNTAVVSNAQIAAPITLTAVTTVTNDPLLSIHKSSAPALPGANKPLAYTLTVANGGQPVADLPITVTDQLPLSTTLLAPGPDGVAGGNMITWTRPVTLALGESTVFTFSVTVGDVLSGTVISNTTYQIASPQSGVMAGKLYTVTVVDPVFSLAKTTSPDPPGSNREMTYTLALLNSGSLATNLVITDRVASGVTYMRGGAYASGVVSWSLPSLDTGESAEFTYTVSISDVMGIPIVNQDYWACSTEGVCQRGAVLTSTIGGPKFEVEVSLDPIAKKPGGGGGPVTPTLVLRNLGPGNALNATAAFFFGNIQVGGNDLYATPGIGTPTPFPQPPTCITTRCFLWVGSLEAGQVVTFTTFDGQNTIGGEEGVTYTATLVITDSLVNTTTVPISGTATGKVTHLANVIPTKSGPSVIGRGQLLTYTINARNGALTTDLPPVLTDTIPLSTTFVSASDGGVTQTISNTRIVSWTLPPLGPGEEVTRTYTVRVDNTLISGTQIINDNYLAFGYGNVVTGALVSGPTVTTTIQEVGLIDSYKEVTPTVARPGVGNVLTYVLHVVNSSALPLTGVTVRDVLPWQPSTYQRDAVASSGAVVSDIVTVRWTGDVGAFASELITLTVLVDPDYEGPVTNTATISHTGLLNPVIVEAVAYVTNRPVLFISKSASPDPVPTGSELAYTIRVVNAGQQATGLVITDVIPSNGEYVVASATANGQFASGQVRWETPVLKPGEERAFTFRVKVKGGQQIVNEPYAVSSSEGVTAAGSPVVTSIAGGALYLPIIRR